jgi:hypothetical protein
VSSDDTGISREDTMKNAGLASTLNTILMQSSEPLYDLAVRKIRSFVSGRILEWRVAGKIAASLCRCLVKVRPVKGLAMLLPMVCDTIKGGPIGSGGSSYYARKFFKLFCRSVHTGRVTNPDPHESTLFC